MSIAPKSIKEASVKLDNTTLPFNGHEQNVSVESVNLIFDNINDVLLEKDKDYSVSGTTGTDTGKYTATITGKGNYKDSVTAKWWITGEDGTIVPEPEISVGQHIYFGESTAYYGSADGKHIGMPYWRILDIDEEGRTALLLSEYLWEYGEGSENQEGLIKFDRDGQSNTLQENPGDWQGSDAQTWCRYFYEQVLNGSPAVKGKEIIEEGTTVLNSNSFDPCNLTENDKVFFLSAAELKKYFTTSGSSDSGINGYYFTQVSDNNNNKWIKKQGPSLYWLRSKQTDNASYVGKITV